MRCVSLLPLFLSGMLLVIADVASGLEELEDSVSGAHPVKAKPESNMLMTPSSGNGVDEDRASFFMELIAAKLGKLVQSLKTKINLWFKSKFPDYRTTRTKQSFGDIIIEGFKENLKKHLRERQLDKGSGYTRPDTKQDLNDEVGLAFLNYRGRHFGRRSDNDGLDLGKLLDDPKRKDQFKTVRSQLKYEWKNSLEAKSFRDLVKKVGNAQAARLIHQKRHTKQGRKIEEAQFNLWILSHQNPEDVLKGAQNNAQSLEDSNIAFAIVDDYIAYLLHF